MNPDLFLFAGEASGDLHGERLLTALHELDPTLIIEGVGGPKMRSKGMKCFLPMEDFEVMGFTDIVTALPHLIRHFHRLKKYLLSSPPQALVLIDYPGFNLRLARTLHRNKCPAKIIQYVCPSVWAWGKWRIPLMSKSLDKLLTLLPFEPEIFHNHPLNAQYIGHPIIERIANHSYDHTWRRNYHIPAKTPLITLFPGSRKQEVERNFPMQMSVARSLISTEFQDIHLAVSCASPKLRPFIESHIPPSTYVIDEHHSYELMRDAQLAIATSGTITLELALHQVPTVVTYAIKTFDTFLARKILRIDLPYYALPNLIAKKEIFPELFGPMLTFSSLEEKVRDYLISECKRQASIQACAQLKTLLGTKNANKEGAAAILSAIRTPSP